MTRLHANFRITVKPKNRKTEEYTVTSVKAKRPYNHITLKPKKLKLAKLQ